MSNNFDPYKYYKEEAKCPPHFDNDLTRGWWTFEKGYSLSVMATDGKLADVQQMDAKTGQLYTWPLPNTIVHWTALIKVNKPGSDDLRCRTIDVNGIAQPLPRPFGLSGVNRIERAKVLVE